jgi:hypothetical protein
MHTSLTRGLRAAAQGKQGLTKAQLTALTSTYRLLKPLLVGKYYLKNKLGLGAAAFAAPFTSEIAFRRNALRAHPLDAKMGGRGQRARYVAVHEALHRVPRAGAPGQRPLGRLREEGVVDAIAARLVAPEYKGYRGGYEVIRRLADLQARVIAKQSGEKELDVLIRQLGVAPPKGLTE